MAIEQDLERWLFASVSKHFDDNKQTLPLYIEGQKRFTRSEKDFLELRMDGPILSEESKDYWRVYIEINVLVQSAEDEEDYHRIHKDVGIAIAAFTKRISVFKYGTGAGDDQSFVGCLMRQDGRRGRERIQVNHFGRIDPKTPLFQSTVEAHYILCHRV